MVQTKGHNASNLTPIGRLYKKEITVKKKVYLHSKSRYQKKKQIPRRKTEDTYEIRVEGRSKEGFISFTKCKIRELVPPRVGSLKQGS